MSSGEDLDGILDNNRRTSSSVTGRNDDISVVVLLLNLLFAQQPLVETVHNRVENLFLQTSFHVPFLYKLVEGRQFSLKVMISIQRKLLSSLLCRLFVTRHVITGH